MDTSKFIEVLRLLNNYHYLKKKKKTSFYGTRKRGQETHFYKLEFLFYDFLHTCVQKHIFPQNNQNPFVIMKRSSEKVIYKTVLNFIYITIKIYGSYHNHGQVTIVIY